MSVRSGACLCKSVSYEFEADVSGVTACHCSQCRRTSGHYWAAFHVPLDAFHFVRSEGLAWYASSDHAKRGFCTRCGSSLFYQLEGEASINVAPGTLDAPTGLCLSRHIFVGSKGDYYEIMDDLPKLETF